MRIAYVIPFFAPAWGFGGPPRVVYDMARELAARGHRIDVLTTDAFDAVQRLASGDAIIEGVHVHRDRNLNNRWASQYNAFLPLEFARTFAKRAMHVDVVHLFDFRTFQNAVAIQSLMRRAAPPYVLSAFGELPRAAGVKRHIKLVYDALFGTRLLRGAARLLAQTGEEAGEYQRRGCDVERIRQLPLAVSLDELACAPPPGAFRERLGFTADEQVVLFLGRIHEYKGIDLLIRAFASACASRPRMRLVIAGRDDGFLARARHLAAELLSPDRVMFPGPIYGADRFTAYRDADLFAMTPTHAEQTSLAALEACACGTPVLLTEQAPIPGFEVVRAGLTVPARLPAIASALADLVDRPDRAEMGRRAAEFVLQHFSWKTVTNSLEEIYSDVLVDKQRFDSYAG
jgi:glycosyltransferase involved in cell wall biosynthesis